MHTFQKSLEAVLQRLGEVEIGQKTLENAGNIAGTENEILLFRNQLKVSKLQPWTKTLKNYTLTNQVSIQSLRNILSIL